MNEQFATLGTAAVLDAEKLIVGSTVEIDGEILVVTNIVDGIHVYFRPLTPKEKFRYRLHQLSTVRKLIIFFGGILIVSVLLWVIKGL